MKESPKIDLVFDMETNDPDDFLTLLLLLGHPQANLKAVTLMPGSAYQVGLVARTLKLFDKHLPLGAYNLAHEKTCVSGWHEKVYGKITPSYEAAEGWQVLFEQCNENTTLVTGAALKNLGKVLDVPSFCLGRLVAQGGVAGEGVVPSENQLEKFKGLHTCPTFNLNGDVPSAFKALESPQIKNRFFVSKNVCHGVVYDAALHAQLALVKEKNLALELIYKGMDFYLAKNQAGKKLHDPLAVCCALNPNIATWAEVELYWQKGEWGAVCKEDTNTWIITDYNHAEFVKTFTQS
ncbi:MAG: hypothetical protein OHK0053_37500 [Microscillaceae bacterium]